MTRHWIGKNMCRWLGHNYLDCIWSFGPFKECKRCGHTVFLNNDGTPCAWEVESE